MDIDKIIRGQATKLRIDHLTGNLSEIECRTFIDKLLVAINYTHCCKSDSEQLPKYWQIKKELITPELKKRFPSIIEWAFEKDWWINNKIAKEEELEPLSV